MPLVHTAPTAELTNALLLGFRELLDTSFDGDFSDDDWDHSLGGTHVWVSDGGRVLSHGSVIARTLTPGGVPLRTGYVEAVATLPSVRRQGHGSAVLRRLAELIRDRFALGALSTGEPGFYRRLGWESWRGPSAVQGPDWGTERTPDDDGGIMILRTPATPILDLEQTIVADWRRGDVW